MKLILSLLLLSLLGCPAGELTQPTLTVDAIGDSEVTLSWPALEGAATYNLTYSTKEDLTGATERTAVTSPYTLKGLRNNTTYYFALVALNGDQKSPLSKVVSAKPLPQLSKIAMDMSSGKFSTKDTEVTVAWFASEDADSYLVHYKEDGATEWIKKSVEKTETSTTIEGLKPNTIYNVKVTAVKSNYLENWSDEVNILTRSITELKGEYSGENIKLTWNKVEGAKGYVIKRFSGSGSTPSWDNSGADYKDSVADPTVNITEENGKMTFLYEDCTAESYQFIVAAVTDANKKIYYSQTPNTVINQGQTGIQNTCEKILTVTKSN